MNWAAFFGVLALGLGSCSMFAALASISGMHWAAFAMALAILAAFSAAAGAGLEAAQ